MRIKPVKKMAESKMILLYLASRMPAGLEHDEFVRFNDEGGWMLYFELEQCLPELAEAGLLEERDGGAGRKLFAPTAQGLQVLSHLKADIPVHIRNYIDRRLADRRQDIQREQEISASYTRESASEYPAALRITEDRAILFEMNLMAPSAEAAELICARFREQAADIYGGLVERLTKDEKPQEEA